VRAALSFGAHRQHGATECTIISGPAAATKAGSIVAGSGGATIECGLGDDDLFQHGDVTRLFFSGYDSATNAQVVVQACSRPWVNATGFVCGTQWLSGVSFTGTFNAGTGVDLSAWTQHRGDASYVHVELTGVNNGRGGAWHGFYVEK